MPFFGSGGGSSVDLASPSAIGSTTPNTGAFTTLSFAPANNTTGFSNTGNSLTGSNAQSLVSLAQTWNTTGTPCAFLLNVTDTASNSASLLADYRVGNATRFEFRKDGVFRAFAGIAVSGASSTWTMFGDGGARWRFGIATTFSYVEVGTRGVISSGAIGFKADTGNNNEDTAFYRDAQNIIAQRMDTSAQALRIYRTYTDASNYERLAITARGTTRFSILAEKAGTGSDRQIEVSFYTSASDPTSTDIASGCFGVWKNSGTGTIKLWANDGGTMKSVSLA